MDYIADTGGSGSISIGVVNACHGLVCFWVFEQFPGRLDDGVFNGPDELYSARFDGFGPLGLVPHHQDRLAERGAFLLNAARIGNQQISLAHQIDEGHIFQRLDEEHVREPSQQAVDGLLHIRVPMHGVDDLNIGARGQASEGGADALESLTETFPPVGGNHDQLFRGIEPRQRDGEQSTAREAISNIKDRVDSGIAGHRDLGFIYVFGDEVPGCAGGCGEVQSGQAGCEHPVHLLGKRLGHIACAESSFDVPDWNAGIERGERTAERGGGVALHQHDSGLLGFEDSFERSQNPGSGLKQGLAGEHQIEIVIRPDVEHGEHLIQHVTVLTCDAYPGFKFRRPGAQVQENRTELDGLGPGPEHEEDLDH